MLKMEVIVHDQQWPQITMTVSRESFTQGKVVQQEKKQYDLAYVKLEEMLHNHAQRLVQELLYRHRVPQSGNNP